ncbi:hypothetical protein JTB14_002288 [Gonioctena quinquepunctata]|nr:hypothetical protein JTB14_002288 [Gonioctena quinquepunctata]
METIEQNLQREINRYTGAFRTSPIEVILAESSSLPHKLRREMLAITYAIRVQSIPNHLNHQCFMNLGNTYSQRQTSIRPMNIRYLETANRYSSLPEDNDDYTQHLHNHHSIAPWWRKTPNINISLNELKKQDTPSSTYKLLFLEQTQKYTVHQIIHTDGSHSLSAINTLEDPFTFNIWAIKILEINTNLTSTNKVVTIMWVPSHTNITGNELADSASKDATTNMVDAGIPVLLEDVEKYVKQKFTEYGKTIGMSTTDNSEESSHQ